jgi:hypothetical protein
VEMLLESTLKLLQKSLWLLIRACEWKMEDDERWREQSWKYLSMWSNSESKRSIMRDH